MTYYDEQLQQLQQQIARSNQLESMMEELRSQRGALSEQVRELEAIKLEEHSSFLESQKKELREAISAGNAALNTTQQVLSRLDSMLSAVEQEQAQVRNRLDALVLSAQL